MKGSFQNFYEIISFHAKQYKNKTALFIDNQKISYQEVLHTSDKLATTLAEKGIKKGDHVALFLQNSPAYVYSIFALSKLGAILVPINTFLKGEELSYILEDSEAVALLASSVYEATIKNSNARKQCAFIMWEGKEIVSEENDIHFSSLKKDILIGAHMQSAFEDTAMIIYTSGTTGKPKGAMLSNKNILSNVFAGQKIIKVGPKDRSIVFLPMFHSFTFTVAMLIPLSVGGSIVIIRSVKPFSNIFKQVLLRRVTLFAGIPDVLTALSKAKLPWYFMRFHKIRIFVSGASTLPSNTLLSMNKKFKKSMVLEGYGLSEASPAVSMNPVREQKVGSVGQVLSCNEVKLVNEELNEVPNKEIGEIIIKGDNIMQGYWRRPDETEKTMHNGWLLTGDLGYIDEDGFIFIVDRKKDLIISRGINIYPKEIESVVSEYPGIANAAVIGLANESSGEIPVIYLELEENVKNFDEKRFKAYMKLHLANYKIPKQIHVRESLPRSASGKILKRVLKEEASV